MSTPSRKNSLLASSRLPSFRGGTPHTSASVRSRYVLVLTSAEPRYGVEVLLFAAERRPLQPLLTAWLTEHRLFGCGNTNSAPQVAIDNESLSYERLCSHVDETVTRPGNTLHILGASHGVELCVLRAPRFECLEYFVRRLGREEDTDLQNLHVHVVGPTLQLPDGKELYLRFDEEPELVSWTRIETLCKSSWVSHQPALKLSVSRNGMYSDRSVQFSPLPLATEQGMPPPPRHTYHCGAHFRLEEVEYRIRQRWAQASAMEAFVAHAAASKSGAMSYVLHMTERLDPSAWSDIAEEAKTAPEAYRLSVIAQIRKLAPITTGPEIFEADDALNRAGARVALSLKDISDQNGVLSYLRKKWRPFIEDTVATALIHYCRSIVTADLLPPLPPKTVSWAAEHASASPASTGRALCCRATYFKTLAAPLALFETAKGMVLFNGGSASEFANTVWPYFHATRTLPSLIVLTSLEESHCDGVLRLFRLLHAHRRDYLSGLRGQVHSENSQLSWLTVPQLWCPDLSSRSLPSDPLPSHLPAAFELEAIAKDLAALVPADIASIEAAGLQLKRSTSEGDFAQRTSVVVYHRLADCTFTISSSASFDGALRTLEEGKRRSNRPTPVDICQVPAAWAASADNPFEELRFPKAFVYVLSGPSKPLWAKQCLAVTQQAGCYVLHPESGGAGGADFRLPDASSPNGDGTEHHPAGRSHTPNGELARNGSAVKLKGPTATTTTTAAGSSGHLRHTPKRADSARKLTSVANRTASCTAAEVGIAFVLNSAGDNLPARHYDPVFLGRQSDQGSPKRTGASSPSHTPRGHAAGSPPGSTTPRGRRSVTAI